MFVLRRWSTFVGKVLHENAGQPPKNGFESFGANSNFVRKTRIFRTFHRQMLRPAKNKEWKMFVSTRWTIYFLEVWSKNAGQLPKNGFESTGVHLIGKIPYFSRTPRVCLAEWLRRLTCKGVDGGSNPQAVLFLPKYFAVERNGSQGARGRGRACFEWNTLCSLCQRYFNRLLCKRVVKDSEEGVSANGCRSEGTGRTPSNQLNN